MSSTPLERRRAQKMALTAITLVAAASGACLFPDLASLDAPKGDAAPSDVASDTIAADAADAGDAGDAAQPVCDPSKPFTAITPIAELDDADDQYKETLTPDELEIWYGFTHNFDGGSTIDIKHAKRASLAAPFGAPTTEPNIAPGDVDPAVTDDGLGLYFAKYGTVGSWDLFQTTRATRADAFGIGVQLPLAIQSSSSDTAPFVAFDKSLYFCSERSGGDHVFVAPFVDGGLGAPAFVGALSSSGTNVDMGVVLTHDGLAAYVSSKRTDLGSAGSLDIFVARRASTADAFGPLTNATELNMSSYDRANWISWDNCRLYFESTRTGGQSDLFMASKTP